MKKNTQAIHTGFQSPDAYGSLAMPVYHVAAYEFDDADSMSDAFCGRTDAPDYSRVTNPTVIYFEKKVRELTGATAVTALSSGMAAISGALFSIASQGKNIVTSPHLFVNSYCLMQDTFPRFGVSARFCDLTDPAEVEKAIDKDTCCVFLEVLTNPYGEVADLKAISEIARRHGVPVVADTTAIPFTRFDAHSLGVDIEVVSSTKYLSGGATSIGGLVIDYGTVPGFNQRLKKEILFNFGAYMTPHVAYMQTLGLETLEARYNVQSANALAVAEGLKEMPGVTAVHYTGLDDNPYHGLAKRQFNGTYSAMVSFDLLDSAKAKDFINRVKLIRRATNLFDNKTLAIHPASTIYGTLTPEVREKLDIHDNTIRLSIGLEDAGDLLDDIRQALA